MKLFSIQTGVFAVVFFVINLLVKKYLFEDEIDNNAIINTLITTLISCLVLYFFNRKKTT